MSQTFTTTNTGSGGDTVKTGIVNLIARTDTLRSSFSGSTPPSGGVVGQFFFDTDDTILYQLKSTGPDVWEKVLRGTLAIADGGTGATTASAARTSLGLGTAAVLASGTGSGDLPTRSQADGLYAQRANNLSDLNSAATSRTNLGLGALAVLNTVGAAQVDDGAISTTAKLANNVVTYGKMQAISASSKLLGSSASGTAVSEITLGTGLSMSGSTLNSTSVSDIYEVSTANQSITTATAITPLSFSIGASETWTAEYTVMVRGSVNVPCDLTISAPSGYNSVSSFSYTQNYTTSTKTETGYISATLNPSANITTFTLLRVNLWIDNGVNAGTVSLVIGRTSGTGTLTILAGCRMVAHKH